MRFLTDTGRGIAGILAYAATAVAVVAILSHYFPIAPFDYSDPAPEGRCCCTCDPPTDKERK